MSPPLIDGRYDVRRQLSPGGGSGEVYEVFDTYEQDVVVLKFVGQIVPGMSPWNEAVILRRLSDPHILGIRNADIDTAGVPYIVTELATHGTLESRLMSTGGLGVDVESVIRWMCQASYGVARAHALSLIHSDIKPANLFVNEKGEALVGDFGGSSLIAPGATSAATFQASAETMAPEVARGWGPGAMTASFASDVYSLGATAFWLLAGVTPHDFGALIHFDAKRQVVATNSPRKLRDIAPHVPQSVGAVVERAIDEDPGKRFSSALEFAEALSSRTLPRRRWSRTNAHPGHTGCWEGRRPGLGGGYVLCVEAVPLTSRCKISTRQTNSGRLVAKGCREVPLRNWQQGVRAVIQSLN
jgi:serine/threonine protein kinase